MKSLASVGFTLIEMLVVLVIMGIVISLAAISLSTISGNRSVKMVASEMHDSVLAAQSQATLMPAILGLKITTQGYQFYRYVRDKKGFRWQPLKADTLSHSEIFSAHRLIAHITQLDQDASQISLDHRKEKWIVFSASGEVTPFTMMVSDLSRSINYELKMNEVGVLTLKDVVRQNS